MRIMQIMSEATTVIAEGEVLQLLNIHDPDVSEARYLEVVRFKTAKLFEAAAEAGAVLAGASREQQRLAAAYGRHIGTAFQLVDDVLDYSGDASALGKNVGDDLREGKPTLPLLVAMQRGTPEQAALIRHAIEHGEVERMAQIVEIVKATGALDATREAAQAQVDQAQRSLSTLPQSEWREALLQLSFDSIHRSS